MPVLIHPGIAVYRYSTRRDSLVHINNIFGIPVPGGGRIHLSLKIPRDILEVFIDAAETVRKDPLLEIADEIEVTLAGLLSHKPQHRKPTLSLPFSNPKLDLPTFHVFKSFLDDTRPPLSIDARRARIVVNRKELPLIKKWLKHPFPPGRRSTILLMLFFSRAYLKVALRPARDENVRRQLFLYYLPSAYFTCQELVKIANKDPGSEVDHRIEAIMAELRKTDPRAKMLLQDAEHRSDLYRDQTETVCLVYWGFHGAWEHYRLNGLLEPRDALKQYLYGWERRGFLKQLHETAKVVAPDLYRDAIFEWSKKLYLGKRGAAAKALHLLD